MCSLRLSLPPFLGFIQDPKRKKALKELDFDWGDDNLYLYFQWPEVLVAFYSVIVSVFPFRSTRAEFSLLFFFNLLCLPCAHYCCCYVQRVWMAVCHGCCWYELRFGKPL